MDLYNLGKLTWHETQTIYHALATLGREALSLVSPATPYVCIGFHQDLQQEVDLDFCKANRIPVFRRDVGGGAVYLDGDQLFFHLILHKKNPAVPKRKESFYKKFLQPIINVYRQTGIPAEFKPVNDVIAGNANNQPNRVWLNCGLLAFVFQDSGLTLDSDSTLGITTSDPTLYPTGVDAVGVNDIAVANGSGPTRLYLSGK